MPANVIMSLIWMKLMEFAMMKTILTALFKMETEENRAFVGIWSEGEQYVDKQIKTNSQSHIFMARELLSSHFENILSSCTTKMSALVAQLGRIKLVNTSLETWNNEGEVMLMGNRIPRDPVLPSENDDNISEGKLVYIFFVFPFPFELGSLHIYSHAQLSRLYSCSSNRVQCEKCHYICDQKLVSINVANRLLYE